MIISSRVCASRSSSASRFDKRSLCCCSSRFSSRSAEDSLPSASSSRRTPVKTPYRVVMRCKLEQFGGANSSKLAIRRCKLEQIGNSEEPCRRGVSEGRLANRGRFEAFGFAALRNYF